MLPGYLMIHNAVLVRPAVTTDSYRNQRLDYGADATRTAVSGWLQQDARAEPAVEGRTPQTQRWLWMSNDTDILARDRLEWAGHPAGPAVYEVDGPPEPVYAAGVLHHVEATLKRVEG